MTHQDYVRAVEHEQSLVRRLFACRERREEAIANLTKERYAHLIGKYISRKNDPDTVWRINDVGIRAGFVGSDKVEVRLDCCCIGTSFCDGNPDSITGLYVHHEHFFMHPTIDIDEHLSGRFVSEEVAMERCNSLFERMRKHAGFYERRAE